MKKISISLLLLTGLLFFTDSNAQFKDRTSSYSYLGGGYTLVFFTNGEVTDTYPVFNLNSSSFLSEVNVFYGMRLSPLMAIEISPSFIFTNSTSNDGFYFTNSSGTRNFYYPNEANLFALPININFKLYPFFADPLSPMSNMYLGAGGGMMYFNEEFDNNVYSDSTLTSFLRFEKSKNSFWTQDFSLFVGFGSTAKFGYAFELGYRFVPVDGDGTKPQTTSLVKNFNSVNLSAKVVFSF
ncbi:MAG: hypothetical protein KDC42_07855 [Ignavibacteriae bacterium]|nr:hypothetical protein [Ignavibacteriota bacterium]